jgi:hypothetical protein
VIRSGRLTLLQRRALADLVLAIGFRSLREPLATIYGSVLDGLAPGATTSTGAATMEQAAARPRHRAVVDAGGDGFDNTEPGDVGGPCGFQKSA